MGGHHEPCPSQLRTESGPHTYKIFFISLYKYISVKTQKKEKEKSYSSFDGACGGDLEEEEERH